MIALLGGPVDVERDLICTRTAEGPRQMCARRYNVKHGHDFEAWGINGWAEREV
jgi:hypothetical protein